MTSVLSPLAPISAPTRDAASVTLLAGQRPVVAIAPVETARALRPVDPANTPELLRNLPSRDPLVGPPPTFEINVLQDIRTRLAEPPGTEPATDLPADDAAAEPTAPGLTEAGFAQLGLGLSGVEPESPHQLDIKL